MTTIVCTSTVYSFRGWLFEFPPSCGPWPLRKDLSPRKRAGRVFYRVVEEFAALQKEEQDKYKVSAGGCVNVECQKCGYMTPTRWGSDNIFEEE